MATSGSYDFSVSGDDIITASLQEIGAIAVGESIEDSDMSRGRRTLNMIVKNLMGPPNAIAPGLKMWQRGRTSLTLTAAISVSLYPATLAYTSGSTEPSIGDTIYGVAGTSDATATLVGLTTTSGTWSGGDAAGDFTLISQSGTYSSGAVNNTSAASSNDHATIAGDTDQTGGGKDIPIPIEIVSALLRDSNNDIPMTPMDLQEFEALGNKTNTGDPSKYYYERGISAGVLRWDRIPSDTSKTVELVYLQILEDFDAAANTPDFPQEWYWALMWLLAEGLYFGYWHKDPPKHITNMVSKALYAAQSFHPETTELHFQPGLD